MNKNKKSVSILGSGWLGLPLIEYFSEAGYTVKASTRSDRRKSLISELGAQPFIVDIENLSMNIQDFLNSPILIINITSKSVDSYLHLIERIENSPVKKVLFISSTSVYKNLNREVSEDEGAENTSSLLYKIEKLFISNKRFETTVIRFAGLVGYTRHPGRWFRFKPVTQPDAPVNLIHRDDCIEIISAIIQNNVWGELFNACADEHPSKKEFYTRARAKINESGLEFENNSELKFKLISNEKLKRILGYQFKNPKLLEMTYN